MERRNFILSNFIALLWVGSFYYLAVINDSMYKGFWASTMLTLITGSLIFLIINLDMIRGETDG